MSDERSSGPHERICVRCGNKWSGASTPVCSAIHGVQALCAETESDVFTVKGSYTPFSVQIQNPALEVSRDSEKCGVNAERLAEGLARAVNADLSTCDPEARMTANESVSPRVDWIESGGEQMGAQQFAERLWWLLRRFAQKNHDAYLRTAQEWDRKFIEYFDGSIDWDSMEGRGYDGD